MERLQKINNQAALNASIALSKLVDKPVSLKMSPVEVRNVEGLSPIIGPEEIVAGIYVPVTGEVKGAAVIIFPKETAFTLSDLLVRREPGITRKLSELDRSALKELGNIISGNYFTVLSNMLQVKIIGDIPRFSFDMFGAVISQVITEFSQKAEKALVIELKFIFDLTTLSGHFLLMLDRAEIKAILRSLDSG